MRIGLFGAHRTGKTTLAKALADKYDLPFISGSATPYFEKHGCLPDQRIPLKKRLAIQTDLLNAYVDRFAGLNDFVTDRTPIDYAAYTIAEINSYALDGEDAPTEQEVEFYIANCLQVVKPTLDLAVMVAPGIPVVEAFGKGSINRPYINHIAMISSALIGQLHDMGFPYFVLLNGRAAATELPTRVALCSKVIDGYEDFKSYMDAFSNSYNDRIKTVVSESSVRSN